jgi:acetyl esterase/lipase
VAGLRLSQAVVSLSRRALFKSALAMTAASALPGCGPAARGRHTGAKVKPTMPFERIAYGGDPHQFAELRRPGGAMPAPVVVVVHGGFWQAQQGLESMIRVCEALAREGFATWNVEYRRVGDAGGGWPGTFLDVGDATDFLRTVAPRHGLDARRVVTLGHSAGGQMALWLAGRRWIRDGELHTPRPLKLRGAVALAGIVDLRGAYELGMTPVAALMGGSPADVPARYAVGDPAALIPLGVPQVLVHGSADTVVPEQLSSEYQRLATARGDDARLVALPGTGHYELIDPEAPAWATVSDSLRTLPV